MFLLGFYWVIFIGIKKRDHKSASIFRILLDLSLRSQPYLPSRAVPIRVCGPFVQKTVLLEAWTRLDRNKEHRNYSNGGSIYGRRIIPYEDFFHNTNIPDCPKGSDHFST